MIYHNNRILSFIVTEIITIVSGLIIQKELAATKEYVTSLTVPVDSFFLF